MQPFREVQRFPIWSDLILLGVGIFIPLLSLLTGSIEGFLALALSCTPISAIIFFGLMRMETVVDDMSITVTFGWLRLIKRRIALSDIQTAQVATYNALADYGGWGIRGKVALTAKGNRGVFLLFEDDRTLLIGSQRPEELLEAILNAKRSA